MNLTEKLLKIDTAKINYVKVKHFRSDRLTELLGADEPVYVTIQELSPERINSLMSGKDMEDPADSYEINSLICCDAITDPNVKDPDLAKTFKCSTPQKLVKKLFGYECAAIANIVLDMAGLTEDPESKVKNS